MTRWARVAYVALVWLFLVGLVVQVFLAGVGIFSPDARDFALHVQLGWYLHLVPVLVLIAAAIGRVGRPTMWWVAALVITTLIQPFLPALRETSVALAALHPVNAMVMFAITARLAWTSAALLPGRQAPDAEDAH